MAEVVPDLAPVPELDPDHAPILAAYYRLGKDANGMSLASERLAALERFQVTDPGARDAWLYLLEEIDAEQAAMRHEEAEKHREEMEEARRRR